MPVTGLEVSRAVRLSYARDGDPRRASGLHLGGGVVVTANHCALPGEDAYRVQVPGDDSGDGYPGSLVWASGTDEVDLAVVAVPGLAGLNLQRVAPARLDRTQFATLYGTGGCYPGYAVEGEHRGLVQVDADIPLGQDADTGFAALQLRGHGPAPLPVATQQEVAKDPRWGGASGAGILAVRDGVAYWVGVIANRRPAESSLTLRIATLDGLARLSQEKQQGFWQALEVDPTWVRTLAEEAGTGGPVARVLAGPVPELAAAYQDRAQVRAQIQLSWAGSTATNAVGQVVTGDGGVGKTQLAAALFLGAEEVDVRVWVVADTMDQLVTGYAHAGARLGLGEESDAVGTASAFRDWLGGPGRDRSWLIVLDDLAIRPVEMSSWWPPPAPRGRVLVTTRARYDYQGEGGRVVVPLGVFTVSEAKAYLQERLGTQAGRRVPADVLDEAAELAEDLLLLPLALAQASAVILNDGITTSAYRAQFADRSRTLADLFPEWARRTDSERTVAATWAIAIDRANQLDPAGLAGPVAELASVLDPAGAPDALFTTPAARAYLQNRRSTTPTPGLEVSEQHALRALRLLDRFSVATHDIRDVRAVRMHAFAQRAIRDGLTPDGLTAVVRATADGLLQAWPPVPNDPAWESVFRANAAKVEGYAPAVLLSGGAHWLLFRGPRSLGESGQVQAAIHGCLTLLTRCQDILGADHPDTLSTRANLASWRGLAGDPSGAAAALEELLTDQMRVLGPDHPSTLTTLHNLAYWRGAAGDPSGAAAALGELLPEMVRVLGTGHPDTLATRGNLASWRGLAGDPPGAAAAFGELLPEMVRVLGTGHPDTLATRGNLAWWRGEAGDVGGAAAALGELLPEMVRVLGPDHPSTLITRNNLACIQGVAGDAGGAAAAFGELLADRLRVLGTDHPDTLATRGNLARWRGESGDAGGAAAAFEELLTDLLRVLGADHPDTLTTRAHLASIRGKAGDAGGAAAALEELLTDQLRVLGPDHPDTLTTRNNLASMRGEAGDAPGAAAAFEELLTDRLRVLGPDHPDTLTTRAHLARWQKRSI